SRARKASQDWLARVRQHQPQAAKLNSYQHFLRFGNAMLDKIASWRGELQLGRDVLFAPGAEAALNVSDPRGKLLLASHLGD
ncbi:glycosyltransferase family 2 protein, partial [Escherichia coli]|nr:glycosyltransferase family 2 protein [Escherichia coli]